MRVARSNVLRTTIGASAAVVCALLHCAPLGAQQNPVTKQEPPPKRELPPITSADYDEHGRFRVNGKPFFPILLYDAPTDPTTLADLRDFGFNTLTCKAEATTALRGEGFYGAVHHAKPGDDASGIFLVLGSDSPALYFKKDLLKQTAEANAKSRAAVPSRPLANAIGFWEDEPRGVVDGKLPARAVYEDLVAAIDVSAPYLYPVPYQPVASVGEAVARARKATGGKKPLLPILQLFAWDEKARYPTVAELRCMTYLALVEGASGIGYYSYGHVTGHPKKTIAEVQPELWKSVKQLNKEIADLAPQVAGGRRPAPMVNPFAGPVAIAAADGGFPVIIVNQRDSEAKVPFFMPDRRGTLLLDDGQKIALNESGGASIKLEPYEVIVVRRLEPK
jgi:hypothetical protein